ncbi:MAG: hypothetical protein M0R06_18920 [Sphaerochaeta sp.]|nr:hypothetical protein [Sphaerochaeta sp.]
MNQVACLRATQNLINDNADSLVLGFMHQGQARSISSVAVSVLVAPSAYYFYVIQVRRVTSEAVRAANVREPAEKCLYDVVVHVADAAMPQYGEDAMFEQMTLDFRKMCDRFVAVLRATRCFTAPKPDDANKFRLLQSGERKVVVTNSDHWWSDEQGQGAPLLYSTIEFTLEEAWAA